MTKENKELAKGDVVYLKSGGPAMTIAKTRNDSYTVQWIDSGENLRTHEFPGACLTQVKPRGK